MTPEECRSLEDIRAQIDRLDRTIVPLLIERSGYVRRAADFKASASDVAAPGRQEVVYENVRRIAAEHGGDERLIERIYRRLVAEFIADQQTVWDGLDR
ncbi:MAG: chorismate mutase [Candidatus Eremiobacteraeota bacterium]|nr:chorismate mutase [Candidatus Eremiobacteraeota bacterium]